MGEEHGESRVTAWGRKVAAASRGIAELRGQQAFVRAFSIGPLRDRGVVSFWEARISGKIEQVKKAGEGIVTSRTARMFGRNTIASTATFLLDLAILWALVELASFAHVPAAVVAFLLPLILFYFLQREWVFPGTQQGVAKGFGYFLVNVGIGFAAMIGVFWALLELTGLHYLVARVVASTVYGVLLFALNGKFNFKEL